MNLKVRAKPHGKICDIGARNCAFQGLHFEGRNELEYRSPFTLTSWRLIGRLRGGICEFSPKCASSENPGRGEQGETCLNPLTSLVEALGSDTSVRVSNFA